MVRIKICGIRRGSDALLAAKLGADAIGVLVGKAHPSSDFIHPEQAADILKELPPFVSGVLVSHLPETQALIRLALAEDVGPGDVSAALLPSSDARTVIGAAQSSTVS